MDARSIAGHAMATTRMKVADYIAEFLASHSAPLVFAISGASNVRILDAINRHADLSYICPHHEQAGVMAANTYGRLSGNLGVMVVTAGPGAVNAVTGVASAHLDSIPVMVLAGQEKSEYLDPKSHLRGRGVQGLDMFKVVEPICKFSASVQDPLRIRYFLERAYYEATTGRQGPVWLDIPADIQTADIDPQALEGFKAPAAAGPNDAYYLERAERVIALLRQAERPLLWIGNGVRLAGAVDTYYRVREKLGVPMLVAWNAIDLGEEDSPLYAGRAGTYGQRAANFAVQNCDLLVCLGTRLAIPQIGYVQEEWARKAKKVVVEIDPAEIAKFRVPIDVVVEGDVGRFLSALDQVLHKSTFKANLKPWLGRIAGWRKRYPPVTPEDRTAPPGKVNSYHFIDRLSDQLTPTDVICTDMGTSLTCTHAAIRIKKGQRMVTSTGMGEMGFGLPGAIGACIGSGRRRTVFVGVEGSLMMNIQELQTVVHQKLPLKAFILNNNGYLTIKHTERALFGDRLTACSVDSGVTFPNLEKVSKAFGLSYFRLDDPKRADRVIQDALNHPGPVFCEVMMPEDQFLGPKSAVKTRADGSLYSPPLEDLAPFLPREELRENMIVPLLPESR